MNRLRHFALVAGVVALAGLKTINSLEAIVVFQALWLFVRPGTAAVAAAGDVLQLSPTQSPARLEVRAGGITLSGASHGLSHFGLLTQQ